MGPIIELKPTPEAWRIVFRQGFAPHLSRRQLEVLREALAADDPRLTQGSTTTPPPLMAVQDWPCEAGCLVAFAGWQGDGLVTVGEVEEFFARLCFLADQSVGDPHACRHLLNYWDDTPREECFREILAEVDSALAKLPAAA